METKFRAPTDEAIRFIAANMRQADAVEVRASSSHEPLAALLHSVELSNYSSVVWINGVPVAIFGLVIRDILTGSGVPWLLSAEQVLNHKREILVHSKAGVSQMLTICPRLFNYVHAENKISIRWLKWLGFSIGEPERYGMNGEIFHRFHQERVS